MNVLENAVIEFGIESLLVVFGGLFAIIIDRVFGRRQATYLIIIVAILLSLLIYYKHSNEIVSETIDEVETTVEVKPDERTEEKIELLVDKEIVEFYESYTKDEIAIVQDLLCENGIAVNVDGEISEEFVFGVKKYQIGVNGLTVDGKAGDKTIRSMKGLPLENVTSSNKINVESEASVADSSDKINDTKIVESEPVSTPTSSEQIYISHKYSLNEGSYEEANSLDINSYVKRYGEIIGFQAN